VQDVSVATTRRVGHYVLTREAEETIPWSQGEIVTERWRRKSEDGNTDTTVWLAPSFRYIPVKMRVKTNYRSIFGARSRPRSIRFASTKRWPGNDASRREPAGPPQGRTPEREARR
jgi:hypothetical protein